MFHHHPDPHPSTDNDDTGVAVPKLRKKIAVIKTRVLKKKDATTNTKCPNSKTCASIMVSKSGEPSKN